MSCTAKLACFIWGGVQLAVYGTIASVLSPTIDFPSEVVMLRLTTWWQLTSAFSHSEPVASHSWKLRA